MLQGRRHAIAEESCSGAAKHEVPIWRQMLVGKVDSKYCREELRTLDPLVAVEALHARETERMVGVLLSFFVALCSLLQVLFVVRRVPKTRQIDDGVKLIVELRELLFQIVEVILGDRLRWIYKEVDLSILVRNQIDVEYFPLLEEAADSKLFDDALSELAASADHDEGLFSEEEVAH